MLKYPITNAYLVSLYLRDKYHNDTDTNIKSDEKKLTNLKIQKILYYAQGWYLKDNEQPLFGDKIEAWRYGPVVPYVYQLYKNSENKELPSLTIKEKDQLQKLPNSIPEYLDKIWASYNLTNTRDLVISTHLEDPWLDSYARPDKTITQDSILRFFANYERDAQSY
ncbi:MAG: hypothetical protein OHK0017_08110 [Patescibacteria group bacterium]